MKGLVSIITPSFNQIEFIEETILSVKNQDYKDIEHIVIDGGSSDGTIKVLKRFPHLRWVSEPDEGQAAAINKGFRMAMGEIIAWLNSDDTYLQGAIRTISERLSFQDVDMVFGDCNIISEDGKIIERIRGHPFNLTHLLLGNCIPQPATFFKREVLERVGYLETRYHHAFDYDYWIRIGLAGFRIRHLPKTIANFRLHKNSKTFNEREGQRSEEREIATRYARRIGEECGLVVKDLEELKCEGIRDVLVYGTGRYGEEISHVLKENGFEILGFMDSRREKWGKGFLDKKILSFDEVLSQRYDAILISSMFIAEIREVLMKNGISEKILIPLIIERWG